MGPEASTDGQAEHKYRVLMGLGKGGSSDVHLALSRGPNRFNKLVVLKKLRADVRSDPEFLDMFFNEARLGARLNHPNIVQTYEVIEEDGAPTIVMEYLDGRPLSAILRRGERPALPVLLRIIADSLAGLQYAHDLVDFDGKPMRVIHRDATPQNIFVTFEGQVKVLDFGIAKLAAWSGQTRQGTIKGKTRYIAPEQIAGGEIDVRVDVYAVGVILWQLATGEPLWKDETEAVIIGRVLRGDIPPPSSVCAEVDPDLERICVKALASNRDERYASAAALESAIDQWLEERGHNVSSRDVGKEVSRLFADVRAYTKSLVDHQLAGVLSEQLRETDIRLDAVSVPAASVSSIGPSTSGTSQEPNVATPPEGKAMTNFRRVLVWGGAVLLLTVLATFLLQRASAPPAPQASAAGGAAAPSGHPSAITPPSLGVARPGEQQAASPPMGASEAPRMEPAAGKATESSLGGAEPSNPMQDDERASAEGVRANPWAERTKRGRVARTAAPPSEPAKVNAPVAKPDCEMPFYINERGIKKLMPECI